MVDVFIRPSPNCLIYLIFNVLFHNSISVNLTEDIVNIRCIVIFKDSCDI